MHLIIRLTLHSYLKVVVNAVVILTVSFVTLFVSTTLLKHIIIQWNCAYALDTYRFALSMQKMHSLLLMTAHVMSFGMTESHWTNYRKVKLLHYSITGPEY